MKIARVGMTREAKKRDAKEWGLRATLRGLDRSLAPRAPALNDDRVDTAFDCFRKRASAGAANLVRGQPVIQMNAVPHQPRCTGSNADESECTKQNIAYDETFGPNDPIAWS